VGRSKKKDWGQIFLGDIFVVFLTSPHREAPKNVRKTIREKVGFGFWSNFLTRFFCKTFFCSVFELPSLKNTQKRDKTKQIEEKLTSKTEFFVEVLDLFFDMDFL
jgi:hypothetical protein